MGGGAERSDDGLGVETLLHIRLELLQELSSQQSDGGGAVSDLRMVRRNEDYGNLLYDVLTEEILLCVGVGLKFL